MSVTASDIVWQAIDSRDRFDTLGNADFGMNDNCNGWRRILHISRTDRPVQTFYSQQYSAWFYNGLEECLAYILQLFHFHVGG